MNSKQKQDPKLPQNASETQRRLAAELEKQSLPAPHMNAATKASLRQNLLAQHGRTQFTSIRILSAIGTAVALIFLASAVLFFWMSQSSRETAVGPIIAARTTETPAVTSVAVAAEITPTPTPIPLPTFPPEFTHTEQPFGEILQLRGFWIRSQSIAAADPIRVDLLWYLTTKTDEDLSFFIQAIDQQGNLAAQFDEVLAAPAYPTYEWVPGRQYTSQISLPFTLPAGQYTLILGVYNRATQERLLTTNDAAQFELANITVVDEGAVMAETAVPTPLPEDGVRILAMQPAAGTILTTSQPITITFAVQLSSWPTATMLTKLVAVMPDGFRDIAETDYDLVQGSSVFTVTLPFSTDELNGPTDLALLVEGRTQTAPRLPPDGVYPLEEAHWRYEP
ncbi:MAG: hypothetical protein H6665_14630 [Ardenticatenaceae bacterium]|nr:hypothetical protein [Ardenticatenaceae bacterium]